MLYIKIFLIGTENVTIYKTLGLQFVSKFPGIVVMHDEYNYHRLMISVREANEKKQLSTKHKEYALRHHFDLVLKL